MSTPEVHGHCHPSYGLLADAFAENFESGEEIGACLAVVHDGELVVDLWAGHADRDARVPWQEDTIVTVFSTGKVVAATLALMLVDEGALELDRPVASYWPEFAAEGKAHVTVRDALTHRACVPSFATPVTWQTPHDWDRMIELIAAEKPWFEPGTLCYHPHTYGFIVGELIRRTTGKNIHQFGVEALFDPLHADFHFKLHPDEFDRVASLTHVGELPFAEGSVPARAIAGIGEPPPGLDLWERPDRRAAIIPGANNYGNARSLAKIGAVIASGGTVDGRTYLSPALVAEACTEQVHAECPCMGDLRLGLTFGLDGPGFAAPTPSCVHWGGYGGSWSVMDPATGTAAAYAMNRCYTADDIHEDPRQDRLWSALGRLLDRTT